VRYTCVGGLASLVDVGMLLFLTSCVEVYYLYAAIIAFSFGLITSYILSIAWVFHERKFHNTFVELGLFTRSCSCSLRLNTRGLPGDCHRSKKVPSIGPSWPLSGSLSPGDALATGCADARRLRSPASLTASHHCGVLTPLLAVAMAGRERAAPRVASRHGR
jgi:hypothetical protein